MKRAMSVADRIVCMLEGEVVATGRAGEMTRDEVLNYYFGHHKSKA